MELFITDILLLMSFIVLYVRSFSSVSNINGKKLLNNLLILLLISITSFFLRVFLSFSSTSYATTANIKSLSLCVISNAFDSIELTISSNIVDNLPGALFGPVILEGEVLCSNTSSAESVFLIILNASIFSVVGKLFVAENALCNISVCNLPGALFGPVILEGEVLCNTSSADRCFFFDTKGL